MQESIDLHIATALLSMSGKQDSKSLEVLKSLFEKTRQGHLCMAAQDEIDSDLCEKLQSPLATLTKPVGFFQGYLYLHRSWLCESIFVSELLRLVQGKSLVLDKEIDLEGLNEEQELAVLAGLTKAFLLITGGPGTGKTYVAKQILSLIKKDTRVLVCAPTGKAVSNIKKGLKNIEGLNISFATLHSALKIRQAESIFAKQTFLDSDLIIVDECSMIDIKVFAKLLQSVHSNTRLILIGDPYQLPPVELGTPFYDMSRICLIPKVELKQSLRIEKTEIIELARSIAQGKCDEKPSSQPFDLSSFITWAKSICYEKNFSFLEEAFADQKILCSHNIGPLGTLQINEDIVAALWQEGKSLALPIMMTKSVHKYDLINGEQGLWIRNETENFLLFDSVDGYRKIPFGLITDYSVAFAISIHKSQGSEYNHIFILCQDEDEMMSRELLYTAITRCRKSVKLFAAPLTIEKALKKSSMKDSLSCLKFQACMQGSEP
jgi:exodeoxyribonuclease V alpha subunit